MACDTILLIGRTILWDAPVEFSLRTAYAAFLDHPKRHKFVTDVRPFAPTPMDLALVRRLASRQLLTDTTIALTRGINPLEAALLAMVPMADLGFPTLVMRDSEDGLIGQIRHRVGERSAHIACLAPIPQDNLDYVAWLQLIDGLVHTAGRRGAWTITAEVLEHEHSAFKLLRKAGFVVYARQTIFRRAPGPIRASSSLERLHVRPANEIDMIRVQALHAALVPSLIQQADPLPEINAGSLVVEVIGEQRLLGYLSVIEGKAGLMVKPYLHPDVYEEAEAILEHAINCWSKAERLPMYFAVRSYQDWLRIPLNLLGLVAGDQQAVFVKHTVARMENGTEPARATLEFGTLVSSAEISIEPLR